MQTEFAGIRWTLCRDTAGDRFEQLGSHPNTVPEAARTARSGHFNRANIASTAFGVRLATAYERGRSPRVLYCLALGLVSHSEEVIDRIFPYSDCSEFPAGSLRSKCIVNSTTSPRIS